MVNLTAERVGFARGAIGGTYADRGRVPANPRPRSANSPATPATLQLLSEEVAVMVRFGWYDAGAVVLDAVGRPRFGSLPSSPGIYRLTIARSARYERDRIYIGETDNLHRRLNGNYRNPGPRQQTSLRINAVLREQLAAGGHVAIAVATRAVADVGNAAHELDLTTKSARLLAESAAVHAARMNGTADVINLG